MFRIDQTIASTFLRCSRQCSCLVALALWLVLSGCDQNMIDQPRYESLEGSAFFDDGIGSRPLVAGTIPRGYDATDTHFLTGLVNDQPVTEFPERVLAKSSTRELLKRGQQRYEIFCTPCHGMAGHGDGMVVQRGFPKPPSFHEGENGERLRGLPVGHLYDVIRNGIGRMSGYASQIPPEDRWAIVAYVRALQVSQHSVKDQLPASNQAALEALQSQE